MMSLINWLNISILRLIKGLLICDLEAFKKLHA